MRVLKQHLEHFPIWAHAEWEWIFAESRRLSVAVVTLEIKIRGAAVISSCICGLFALAEDFIQFAGQPSVLFQYAPLRHDDVIGRDDAGFFVERFHDRTPAVREQF